MGLAELLLLGAQLDDLLLPWQIDLQLRHLIRHPELLGPIAFPGDHRSSWWRWPASGPRRSIPVRSLA